MAQLEWKTSREPVAYPEALERMEERVMAILHARAPELVWLLEHPPLYTAGVSAKDADLLEARFPVFKTGRGGQYTYHGPGQRVVYLMLDLRRRRPDVRAYVRDLERWLIEALARLGVRGETRQGRVGIWVPRSRPLILRDAISPHPEERAAGPRLEGRGGMSPQDEGSLMSGEDKIAAIGVRVRRWVTYHGVSLNVAPDLSHYSGIVPCGIGAGKGGVTSLEELGRNATMAQTDEALKRAFATRFALSPPLIAPPQSSFPGTGV